MTMTTSLGSRPEGTVTATPARELATVRYEPCGAYDDDPTSPGGACAGCGWLAGEHHDTVLANAA